MPQRCASHVEINTHTHTHTLYAKGDKRLVKSIFYTACCIPFFYDLIKKCILTAVYDINKQTNLATKYRLSARSSNKIFLSAIHIRYVSEMQIFCKRFMVNEIIK